MKKFAFAVVLCVSAFSPSFAQDIRSTFTILGASTEVITTKRVFMRYTQNGREQASTVTTRFTLNGTDITDNSAIGSMLAGATCRVTPGLITCTK